MSILTQASQLVRSQRDPRVLRNGSGSRSGLDQLARAIGWFSIGLGLSQLVGARRYTRALGIPGREPIVRAFGAREIAHGVLTLSTERKAGLWSRVGGDALDIAGLGAAMRNNAKRDNVALALALVVGVTVLDVLSARGMTARHSRRNDLVRDYRDRSGFPGGIVQARGAAARLRIPEDMTTEPRAARLSQMSG